MIACTNPNLPHDPRFTLRVMTAHIIGGVFLLFTTLNVLYHSNDPGDDLFSSYAACILLKDQHADHLYRYDTKYYNLLTDPLWTRIATQSSFRAGIHPYVQAPSWAFILRP